MMHNMPAGGLMDREKRINELISQMTLEEKVSQLSYTSVAIPRLGIPEYNWWNECLHGVARAGIATVFPQAIALAATFDEGLVEEVAVAISDEARAKYNEAIKQGNRGQYWGLTYWTPNINIFRDPRWGRGQETYGEDPFLTGKIGIALVKGLQGDDPENLNLAACAKHYAVHSGPEKLRHTFDAVCSKKDLFETYLPAFKALIDAGVESVMGAYNRTLGEPCCGSYYLLKDILRDSWGFTGHVVSDCWAIRDFHEKHQITKTPEESAALALNAGCDLNCGCTYPQLTVSFKKGLVSEETINTALARLLRTRLKLGLLDPPERSRWGKLGRKTVNCEKHQQLALKAAEKSIVLLKNDRGILPLDSSAKKISVMGPGAANPHTLFGNYYGISSRFVTILEGLGEKVRDKFGINLEYRQGCLMYGDKNMAYDDQPLPPPEFLVAHIADVSIVVMGLDGAIEGEEGDAIASDSNGDRDYIELPPWQLKYLQRTRAITRAAHKDLILVLTGGSPIAIPEDIADAIIFAWYPGELGGKAVADIIFGDTVPSGKLPITFPASTDQLPPYTDYSMKGRTYRYMTQKPLYPFGFGLSYTSFRFDSISLSVPSIKAGGTVKVTVTISNTGKHGADEVVQIYITKDERGADEPLASLRAFSRVFIPAGKSVTLHFDLASAAFETVNAEGEYELLPGSYTIIASDAAPVSVAVEKGAPAPVQTKIKLAP
jgi:beta-glucosidase